jgi:hypothetical protein
MPQKKTNPINFRFLIFIITVSTFIIFSAQTLIIPEVEADQQTQTSTYQVAVSNQVPTGSGLACCFGNTGQALTTCGTTYTMSSATNYDMDCNVTISDGNGYLDMGDGWVNMTWYRSSVAWNSAQSNDTLYLNSSCKNLSSTANGNTLMYQCQIKNIKYWADAGTWKLLINSSDGTGAGTPYSTDFTISSVPALWQSSTINFGSMGLGEISDVNKISITNNTGNARIRITAQASGATMGCTIGSIPAGNISYDVGNTTFALACGHLDTTDQWWASCNNLSIPDCSGSCLSPFATNSSSWGISIPSAGVGGSCSLSVTITANLYP